ncbi:N-acetyl-gamma-glutamyl-phosphate reductase [Sphingorhabdus arenilitoris]|uniref:N-acetyl-gamma-glutamyl-phosphate reductase n=1 Tax=Sphingorhabdus arenilitoris TaxID=1490041 RepID=A0ABV8RHB9_9SPHN
MTKSIFIDGAAGTTGLEIAQRLSGRSEFALICLDERRRKDISARREAMNDADFVILCLPDEAVNDAAAMVTSGDTAIIDASSVNRVADGWTYGFPELKPGQREAIAKAKRVSNPGCYPTGFLALLAPLVSAGLLPADWPYTVNALSGYSGGGKAMIARFEEAGTIAARGYGYDLAHKHLPEMQKYAGLSHPPIFAPTVVNAFRGMIVEIPLPLFAMPSAAAAGTLRDALASHYASSPLVTVAGAAIPSELLMLDGADGRDDLQLFVAPAADGKSARLIAMLDNLGKGASGAAVQNLNIMAGLDEAAGLRIT